MFICRVRSNPRIIVKFLAAFVCFFCAGFFHAENVLACSCSWKGPFMTVAGDSRLVVLGRIIRHNQGPKPSMDVHVKEVLSGAMLDSGLRILMGDGMYCRPEMSLFPPGTDWILAINGPGSKPGKDLAISICGEYWLKVEGDEVVGSIYGKQDEIRREKLDLIRNYFRYPGFEQQLRGKVEKGERFAASFGIRFEFLLEPVPGGWEIVVREKDRDENLARLTPPLHSLPNPRFIEACHFKKPPENCPCAHGFESGPFLSRKIIFSPEIGGAIAGPRADRSVTPEEVKRVEGFGSGEFRVEKTEIEEDEKGCPVIRLMEFRVFVRGDGIKPDIR